jgi:hypothetical protein
LVDGGFITQDQLAEIEEVIKKSEKGGEKNFVTVESVYWPSLE